MCAYLGITLSTFDRWRCRGLIPAPAGHSPSGANYWTVEQAFATLKKITETA